jgi:hypothetical protein
MSIELEHYYRCKTPNSFQSLLSYFVIGDVLNPVLGNATS